MRSSNGTGGGGGIKFCSVVLLPVVESARSPSPAETGAVVFRRNNNVLKPEIIL